jgi:hypothetical protein
MVSSTIVSVSSDKSWSSKRAPVLSTADAVPLFWWRVSILQAVILVRWQVLARAECLKSGNPLDYSQRNSNYERDAFFTKRKKKKLESEHWCAQ